MKLRNVRLNTPNYGYDFTSCGPNTLADIEIYLDENTINICNLSLIGDIKELSQALVREASHLIG
ncbi:MAG: hypothetical protein Fur0010_03770 [Bdellovibrio sp.]